MPTAPRLVALFAAAAAISSCGDELHTIRWRIDLSDAVRAQTVALEVAVRAGACTGSSVDFVGASVIYDRSLAIDEVSSLSPPPRLSGGRYCFAVRLGDASCSWFADARDEVSILSGSAPAEIRLMPRLRGGEARCAPNECSAGRCTSDDAGVDAGARMDAGREAGSDANVDDAGLDASTPGFDGSISGCPGFGRVAKVGVGIHHACALSEAGTLHCWGTIRDGRIGVVGVVSAERPVRVPGTWTDVAVGYAHTCALDAAGALYCWGDGAFLGMMEPTPRLVSAGPWASISAGAGSTCGSEAGITKCFGDNYRGKLGVGDQEPRATPTTISNHFALLADGIRTGIGHTIAISSAGELNGWGNNIASQAAPGFGSPLPTPARSMPASARWTNIAIGQLHSCGVRFDGSLWCWGSNGAGELGQGDTNVTSEMVRVGSGNDWIDVGAGARHSCAITDVGDLYCWGANLSGNLGDGTTTTRHLPTRVGAGERWRAVEAGGNETGTARTTCGNTDAALTCALTHDGRLYCWGDNACGQVGAGDTTPHLLPTFVCIEPDGSI